jgi:anti-sigma-K factor RskA
MFTRPEAKIRMRTGLGRRIAREAGRAGPARVRPPAPRVRWAWWGVALAAAVAVAAVGCSLSTTREELARLRGRVATLQGEVAERGATLRLLSDPEARSVTLAGLPASPRATGWLLWNPSTRQGLLLARGLPAAPAGRAYALWALAGAEPVPAGVFTVDAMGRAAHRLPPLPEAKAFDRFAVTLEPAGGVARPTGPMHLLGGR